jgi:uncharacterized delta-60 repeat protein
MIPIPSGMVLRRQWDTAGQFTNTNVIRTSIISYSGDALNTVRGIVEQPDGKIIVIGEFVKWCGAPLTAKYIVRLNTDNSLDTVFSTNLGTGFVAPDSNYVLRKVLLQNDGKILILGYFTSFNGTFTAGLARLNSDGTLDTAFAANIGSNNNGLNTLALQADGKIILGGLNSFYWNGAYRSSILRLNADGTIDSSFTCTYANGPSNVTVNQVAVQSDGKILYALNNGTYISGVGVNSFGRLNADGTLDTAFSTNLGNGAGVYDSEFGVVAGSAVYCMAIKSDGKIIVGGPFTYWNDVDGAGGLVLLNSNGTLNTYLDGYDLSSSSINAPYSITIQSDGKFFINNYSVGSFQRHNANGTKDVNFSTLFAEGPVQTAIQLSSGQYLAGGYFNSWQGDSNYQGIVKINSAMTALSTFTEPIPDLVFAIVVGGGGRGNNTQGCGGGAGAIVYGLVPKSTSVTVGAGGQISGTPGNGGDPSTYSTLYADGGGGGALNSSLYGGGATAPSGTATTGTNLMYAVGGNGGASVTSTGTITGSAGGSGTSGGSGGGATNSASGGVTTGGVGGRGFVGGGGGAARITVSSSATATAGAGGAGVYAGGAGGQLTGTSLKYCGGGGGGGYLGAGANGDASATATLAYGGFGGLGGGGGGGSANPGVSQGGSGGTGCVLLYW